LVFFLDYFSIKVGPETTRYRPTDLWTRPT